MHCASLKKHPFKVVDMRNVDCEYTETEKTLPFYIPTTKHTYMLYYCPKQKR